MASDREIANLEWAVVEEAVKHRERDIDEHGLNGNIDRGGLWEAVDRLIAIRRDIENREQDEREAYFASGGVLGRP